VDGAGNLQLSGLYAAGPVLHCACGARYPVVAGIPIVLADVASWAASEGLDALRADADPELLDLLLPPGSAAARNRELARVYADAPRGPLVEWVDAELSRLGGLVLELGSGPGHPGTVRVDLNHRLLRAGPSPVELVPDARFEDSLAVRPGVALCADAIDPPFPPECFDAVALVNLLDSCRDPGLALAQAEALLKPGGTLLITCAFAFGDPTPLSRRFDETDLLRALSGEGDLGGHALGSRVERVDDDLEWILRISPRTRHVHRALALVARKPG